MISTLITWTNSPYMLPLPLLWLLALIGARTALTTDYITSLGTGSLSNPPSFSIPSQGQDGSPLSVTIGPSLLSAGLLSLSEVFLVEYQSYRLPT
ncbi:hypothetical protein CPB84DRAFT_1469298 [Gymnopilus junonius]|uniref:Uncharacterized protein n=1 Tax=Gymnopilus junonius TaxID=109634 RepID=A0A9P5NK54_GYMJU|nr:hypothetical protein CPB84DRAFT_1469298 [Gymnopilus junonius]